MNGRTKRERLEDVLNDYTATVSEPSSAVLWEWIQRYPYYERELTEFTVSWTLMETMPSSAETEDVDEDALVRQGMNVVDSLLSGEQPSSEEGQAFAGLVGEGKVQGLSLQDLAGVTGLSPALVAKLDRRLIRFRSIPGEKIGALARAVRRLPEEVAGYLRGRPQFPAAARFHADEAPEMPEQQDFFEAVREDRGLSEEQRQVLLSLQPSKSE